MPLYRGALVGSYKIYAHSGVYGGRVAKMDILGCKYLMEGGMNVLSGYSIRRVYSFLAKCGNFHSFMFVEFHEL